MKYIVLKVYYIYFCKYKYNVSTYLPNWNERALSRKGGRFFLLRHLANGLLILYYFSQKYTKMSKKWSKAAGRKKKRKKGYTYYYIFSLGTYWGQVALKNHSSCLNDTSVKGRRFSSETTRSLLVPIWSSWVSPIPQWAIMIQKCLE